MCSGYRRLRTCCCWKLALLVSSSSHGRRPSFYSIFWSPAEDIQTHQIRIFTELLYSLFLRLVFIATPGGAHLDFNREEDVALFYVLRPDFLFFLLIYGNWFDLVACWNVDPKKWRCLLLRLHTTCIMPVLRVAMKAGAEWKQSASKLLRCALVLSCFACDMKAKTEYFKSLFQPGPAGAALMGSSWVKKDIFSQKKYEFRTLHWRGERAARHGMLFWFWLRIHNKWMMVLS